LNFYILFQFEDLQELDDKAESVLQEHTGNFIRDTLEGIHTEDKFVVLTQFTASKVITAGTRRRNLEALRPPRRLQDSIADGLEVSLALFVETRSPNVYTTETLQKSIAEAFDSSDERFKFIEGLQNKNKAFSPINAMIVKLDDEVILIKKEKESTAWLFIGIGTGVGAVAISLFLFIGYRRRRRSNDAYENQPSEHDSNGREIVEEINVQNPDTDISTLGDPVYGGPVFGAQYVQGDDQHNESMLSAGYDYKLAYLGAGDLPSVSSAGGTRSAEGNRALADDLTHDEDDLRLRAGSVDTSRVSEAEVDQSHFEEDNSFDQMYGEDERIDVIAPPGKLGIVIDTPMNGFPMVHAIKETSVLSDRVRIGDKLVSVDGEDTTELSAIRVSKLISSKAMNAQRHMIFLRSPG